MSAADAVLCTGDQNRGNREFERKSSSAHFFGDERF